MRGGVDFKMFLFKVMAYRFEDEKVQKSIRKNVLIQRDVEYELSPYRVKKKGSNKRVC